MKLSQVNPKCAKDWLTQSCPAISALPCSFVGSPHVSSGLTHVACKVAHVWSHDSSGWPTEIIAPSVTEALQLEVA